MKTALITLGFLLATAQAAPRSLKSLLETNAEDISQNPTDYGFKPNCTITTAPTKPGGTPTIVVVDIPTCVILPNSTGAGLPELSSASVTGYTSGAVATQS